MSMTGTSDMTGGLPDPRRLIAVVYAEHATYPGIADVTSDFVYARLRKALPSLLKRTGSRTVFEANVFKELVMLATELSNERMRPNPIA